MGRREKSAGGSGKSLRGLDAGPRCDCLSDLGQPGNLSGFSVIPPYKTRDGFEDLSF